MISHHDGSTIQSGHTISVTSSRIIEAFFFLFPLSFLGLINSVGTAFQAPTLATGMGGYIAQVSGCYGEVSLSCVLGRRYNVEGGRILLCHKICVYSEITILA